MVSGVYRLPTMENVIFRKRFVELLAQEVDRVDYGLYAAMRLPTSARSIALSRCRSRRAKEAQEVGKQFPETGSRPRTVTVR